MTLRCDWLAHWLTASEQKRRVTAPRNRHQAQGSIESHDKEVVLLPMGVSGQEDARVAQLSLASRARESSEAGERKAIARATAPAQGRADGI